MQHLVRSTPEFCHALHPQLVSVCQSHPFQCLQDDASLFGWPLKDRLLPRTLSKTCDVGGFTGHTCVYKQKFRLRKKNTKLTKENKDTEKGLSLSVSRVGGVRWGRDGHLCSLRSC